MLIRFAATLAVGAAVAVLCLALPAGRAWAGPNSRTGSVDLTPPVDLTAEQDLERTMGLLHITSLRPGADGMNANSPNYANYDEAKANPRPNLPNPLRENDGKPVTTAREWWKVRRPQIVAYFDKDFYGRVPAHTPPVRWEVVEQTDETQGGVPVIVKKLVGVVDNSRYPLVDVDMRLTVAIPAHADHPVPMMLQFGWNFPPGFFASLGIKPYPGPSWKDQVLALGWGYAVLDPTSVQADNGADLTRGIIGLCNHGQPRGVEDWGALRAWAWGASQVLDYFETVPQIDARHVGLEGHSRYGKAALVAMAYDQRFAIAYVSSSGEAGAKLWRRHWGEEVGNIASSGEYHWMDGNFLRYDGPLTVSDMPVDSHELIAMCAPRPVFISAGTLQKGDGWVDAKGSFMAAAAASPVYELLGKKGLGTDVFPPTGTALVSGDIAFRQHHQGHTDAPNWPVFLKFASRYMPVYPTAETGATPTQ